MTGGYEAAFSDTRFDIQDLIQSFQYRVRFEVKSEIEMVEVAGVEPACRQSLMVTSTCLSGHSDFSSFVRAGRQA